MDMEESGPTGEGCKPRPISLHWPTQSQPSLERPPDGRIVSCMVLSHGEVAKRRERPGTQDTGPPATRELLQGRSDKGLSPKVAPGREPGL